MSSEFNEVYHHRMRYFLTPQFDIYKTIRDKFLVTTEEREVLDYGCGNGVGAVLLQKKGVNVYVIGVDSDEEAIVFANDCWGHLARFVHDDWARHPDEVPFSPRYDLICCLEVIEHVKDPVELLHRLKQTMKPDGCMVISTVNHNSQFRKNRGHIGKFCIEDFRKLLSEHFTDVNIYDYTLEDTIANGDSRSPMLAVCRS